MPPILESEVFQELRSIEFRGPVADGAGLQDCVFESCPQVETPATSRTLTNRDNYLPISRRKNRVPPLRGNRTSSHSLFAVGV